MIEHRISKHIPGFWLHVLDHDQHRQKLFSYPSQVDKDIPRSLQCLPSPQMVCLRQSAYNLKYWHRSSRSLFQTGESWSAGCMDVQSHDAVHLALQRSGQHLLHFRYATGDSRQWWENGMVNQWVDPYSVLLGPGNHLLILVYGPIFCPTDPLLTIFKVASLPSSDCIHLASFLATQRGCPRCRWSWQPFHLQQHSAIGLHLLLRARILCLGWDSVAYQPRQLARPILSPQYLSSSNSCTGNVWTFGMDIHCVVLEWSHCLAAVHGWQFYQAGFHSGDNIDLGYLDIWMGFLVPP